MHIFYSPVISSNLHQLDNQESKHCINVLRLKTGDEIVIIDGEGGYYTAKIVKPEAHNCVVEIINKEEKFGKRDFKVHIAIAPTKNIKRLEWFLEKATEIGIDEITPLVCKQSERKTIRYNRLEKVIISAMKQSVKAYKPILNEITLFNEFIELNYPFKKFIAYSQKERNQELKKMIFKGENILVLIGPEGDFTKSEINIAVKNGFSPVQLGKTRLRTETAGIVACHTVSLVNQ